MASHWTENVLIILLVVILVPIIFYWNSLPDDNRWSASADFYDIVHRSKRAPPIQALFGELQNAQECCSIPPIIPSATLQRCGGNNQVVIPVIKPRLLLAPKQAQGKVIDSGFFDTIRQLFARSRFGKRKRRYLYEDEVEKFIVVPRKDAFDNAILENLRQIFTRNKWEIIKYDEVEEEIRDSNRNNLALNTTLAEIQHDNNQQPEDQLLQIQENSRDTLENNKFEFKSSGFIRKKRQDGETAPPPDVTTPSPEDTLPPIPEFSTPKPSLLRFGVDAVCYTDCVYRDLKLLSETNAILPNEAFYTFVPTMILNVPSDKDKNKWQKLIQNACETCYGPAMAAAPEKIQLASGRICSTRPIFYTSCIRRYMYLTCTYVNPNKKCSAQLKKLNDTFHLN